MAIGLFTSPSMVDAEPEPGPEHHASAVISISTADADSMEGYPPGRRLKRVKRDLLKTVSNPVGTGKPHAMPQNVLLQMQVVDR